MTNHTFITTFVAILLFTIGIFPSIDSLHNQIVNSKDEFNEQKSDKNRHENDTLLKKLENTNIDTDSITISNEITIPDSISKNSNPVLLKDTLTNDSIKIKNLRDSYLKLNKYNLSKYQRYPQSIDSLYNSSTIYPFQIFQTDGMDLFEIMDNNLSFVSIPVALSSNLNNFLFYGYPINILEFHPNNSLFNYYTDPEIGLNMYSITEIEDLQFSFPSKITFTTQPFSLAKPETNIFIELGPFKENCASIRFARPLGNNIHIGIFSNYKFLNRQNYSHRRGGIYSSFKTFYKKLGIDTLLVSNRGTNPLTKEHISSAKLTWKSKNGMESNISYRYSDIHNDISFENFKDTLNDSLYLDWEKRSHYIHSIQSRLISLPLSSKFYVHAETFLEKKTQRLTPISEDLKGNKSERGESFVCGGAIKSDYLIGRNDSLSLKFSVERNKIERYNTGRFVTHKTKNSLNYINNYSLNSLRGSINGSIGYTFVKLNGKLEHLLVGSLLLSHSIAKQQLSLYAKHDIIPPIIPYDTLFSIIPGNIIDDYQSFGAEAFFTYKLTGLRIGACLMNDVRKNSILKVWPKGIIPYNQPRWVFNVVPYFGQFNGLSFSSQWLFSDKKPYIKSKSTISYHFNRPGKVLHLFLDAGMNYWSKRDSIKYAGIDTWNRPNVEFNFKTSVQIKSFRLFYRIDNIFNRKISYLPGYFMPGIVFRYGFNWVIQG